MKVQSGLLAAPPLRHAFFTREGGVSQGVFASLNCSLSSGDDLDKVAENRRRAMAELGLGADALATVHQVHSPDVVLVDAPFPAGARPKADAMVTKRKGLALGILTADCAPVLFADERAGIVAAAHAGWRGAVTGVLEATVAAMLKEGASLNRIIAAIGPCIGFNSYEVGPEFPAPILAQDAGYTRFFRAAPRPRHHLFDLPGYCRARLEAAGVKHIDWIGGDTARDDQRFFSWRRTYLAQEKQFGHQLSAICLAP
ncbi:MAG TPA: peptidoglycan editing factor PgeF [Stellaceae bacterium]|nr:peptidoglycan editing factor PgeF [Stellaceae bacterium]